MKFRCGYCKKVFSTKKELFKHMKEKEGITDPIRKERVGMN